MENCSKYEGAAGEGDIYCDNCKGEGEGNTPVNRLKNESADTSFRSAAVCDLPLPTIFYGEDCKILKDCACFDDAPMDIFITSPEGEDENDSADVLLAGTVPTANIPDGNQQKSDSGNKAAYNAEKSAAAKSLAGQKSADSQPVTTDSADICSKNAS